MPEISVNGTLVDYPNVGDVDWGNDATNFAILTSAALGKLGLASGTSVDIGQTLDVNGNTTLDANLSVGGNTTLTGNLSVNGNSTLGNGTSDTTAITGILNVDSGVLYVDPTNSRVGINDATPSEALDVTGNALISGTLGVTGNSTFTGDVIASIVKASGSGGLTIDSNGGTDVALFGAGGGAGTTLYGGLNGTTGNFADTTDATSSTDGALKTAGGVGIAKKLFVGTDATVGGITYLDDDTTANTPVLSFTGDTNTGIGRSAADTLDFITDGNSRFKIESTGQIKAVYESTIGTDYNTQLDNGYLCRAWVNFNGTLSNTIGTYTRSGTTITCAITSHGLTTGQTANLDFTTGGATDGIYVVTVTNANTFTVEDTVSGTITTSNVTMLSRMIRASGNVSSITDNTTGDYTVNFTTAMPDADYSIVLGGQVDATGGAYPYFLGLRASLGVPTTKTTSAFRIVTQTITGSQVDVQQISCGIFR